MGSFDSGKASLRETFPPLKMTGSCGYVDTVCNLKLSECPDPSGTEPIDMPLAAIVGIWLLLAPPSGGASGPAMYVAQAASSGQDSQSGSAQPQPAAPNSENKPAPAAEQNPAKAGSQEETAKPGQESQPSQTETPPAPPPSSAQPETTQPAPVPEQPKAEEPKATTKSVPTKSKAGTSKTARHRKRKSAVHASGSTTSTAPRKKVVRNGSTNDPTVQLSPGLSQQQASSQRQNTDQLLVSTEANLKKVAGRQLSASQQESADQIRQYARQANAAVAAGDVERGHNLAVKAHLLSEELVRH